MRRSRFRKQQIAFALQQAQAGMLVAEVCREMGISEPAYFRRKKFAASMS